MQRNECSLHSQTDWILHIRTSSSLSSASVQGRSIAVDEHVRRRYVFLWSADGVSELRCRGTDIVESLCWSTETKDDGANLQATTEELSVPHLMSWRTEVIFTTARRSSCSVSVITAQHIKLSTYLLTYFLSDGRSTWSAFTLTRTMLHCSKAVLYHHLKAQIDASLRALMNKALPAWVPGWTWLTCMQTMHLHGSQVIYDSKQA